MKYKKLKRKFTREGIKRYVISEVPANLFGLAFAAGIAEFVRMATGSILYSAFAGTAAGDIGFFIVKIPSYWFLYREDYSKGKRSFSRDMKSISKSVSLTLGLSLVFLAPLQYFLQADFNFSPAIAVLITGGVAGIITVIRWLYDVVLNLFNSRKNKK